MRTGTGYRCEGWTHYPTVSDVGYPLREGLDERAKVGILFQRSGETSRTHGPLAQLAEQLTLKLDFRSAP